MKAKQFANYEKACEFCEKVVDGEIEWCRYNRKQYWIVWYTCKAESEVSE